MRCNRVGTINSDLSIDAAKVASATCANEIVNTALFCKLGKKQLRM